MTWGRGVVLGRSGSACSGSAVGSMRWWQCDWNDGGEEATVSITEVHDSWPSFLPMASQESVARTPTLS